MRFLTNICKGKIIRKKICFWQIINANSQILSTSNFSNLIQIYKFRTRHKVLQVLELEAIVSHVPRQKESKGN